MSVPLSVTPLQTALLFCLSMESSYFLAISPPCGTLQNVDLGPVTPKICTESQIACKSACMADRPEMFGPTRGFSGMVDSMEPCKMLWADPCCHGNKIWARRGDPVNYWLVR